MANALENSKLSGEVHFGLLSHLINSTLKPTKGYIQDGKSFHMNWQVSNYENVPRIQWATEKEQSTLESVIFSYDKEIFFSQITMICK